MRSKNWNWIEYRRRNERYRDEYKQEIKNTILEIVRIYGMRGGISHNQLSKELDLDPKNLRPYIRELVKEGLVKKGDGLQGKYLPAEQTYKDQLLNAYLFGNNFKRNILRKDPIITSHRKVKFVIPLPSRCVDFTIYKRYFELKFDENSELEHNLFEFSNKIGAFITYFLIHAMDADRNKLRSNISTDLLLEEMVRKTMSTIVPDMISIFKDSVYKGLDKYPLTYKKKANYSEKRPRHIFEKDVITELRRSFVHIYPLMAYELDKINEKLSEEAVSFKKHLEYMRKKWKQQELCEHEYNVPTMTIHGYCGKQCGKCHYIDRVKDSVCTILSKFEKLLEDGYNIEEIKPSEFNTASRINSLEVILISYQGEKKSIKGIGEEAHALRQLIRTLRKNSISN
jgi:predicted transcriptional regulator